MIICDAMDEMNNSDDFDADNERIVLQFKKVWIDLHLSDRAGRADYRWLALAEAGDPDEAHLHGLSCFLSCVQLQLVACKSCLLT